MTLPIEIDELERAFAMLDAAPKHYQVLLLPIFLRASQGENPELVPFIRLMVNDPYFGHILRGGQVEPFLPESEWLFSGRAGVDDAETFRQWPEGTAERPSPEKIAELAAEVPQWESGAYADASWVPVPGSPEIDRLRAEIRALKVAAARVSIAGFKMAQHYEENAAVLRQGLRVHGLDPDEMLRAARREKAASSDTPVGARR